MKFKNLIPFGVFLGLAILLASMTGLGDNPNFMPNMIGKKLEAFTAEDLNGKAPLTLDDFKKEPAILNVWASWCVSCRFEEDVLKEISKKSYKLYGLATADQPDAVKKYLKENGNPYTKVFLDPKREISIGMGVVGTPETFIVSKDGVVFYHFRGPITDEELNSKIIPIIEELKKK